MMQYVHILLGLGKIWGGGIYKVETLLIDAILKHTEKNIAYVKLLCLYFQIAHMLAA